MTWVYTPQPLDCPSAQEPVALIWASCSRSQTSTPAALSSGRNTPEAPSLPPSGPDTSPPRRSGMTSQPSTPAPSPERSTPCWLAILVSHSARRGSEKARMTSGTSGPTSSGSSESSDPACAGAFSRMSRATSPLALRPCCEAYETWVSRLRLAYSQRKKSARRMKGSGFSSWPTATQMQTREGWSATEIEAARDKAKAAAGNGNGFGIGLGAAAGMAMANWTTPQAHDVTARGSGQKPTSAAGNACPATDAMNWPTPMAGTPAQNGNNAAGNSDFTRRAEELAAGMWGTPRGTDGEKGGPNMSFGAGGTPLPAQAAKWPTPASRDHKGENSPDHLSNGSGRLHLDQLPNAVAFLYSPPDPATAQRGLPSSEWRLTSRRLFRSAMSSVPATTQRRWLRRGAWRKARLNPLFVEWLQAFPPGHAVLGFWETPLSLSVRPTHGGHSQPHTVLDKSTLLKAGDQNEGVCELREGVCPEGKAIAQSEGQSAVLLDGLRERSAAADADSVPILRMPLYPIQAGNQSGEILQSQVQRGGATDGEAGALSGAQSRGRERRGAPQGDGRSHWPETDAGRGGASHQRGQGGQQDREPAADDGARTRAASSPTDAPAHDGLCDLRNDVHAPQDEARQDQHMFSSVQSDVCSQPAMGFLIWSRRMRGALSALPTASGAWIWEPPEAVPPVKQMTFEL